jgi:3-methylfumaryl-CoA hydratase
MSANIDLAHLRGWVGREEIAEEMLTASLAERFHATLSCQGSAPKAGEIVPRLMHFCLCQSAAPMDALGEDGHPSRGGFLPPVPLPRRMWAGSSMNFHGDLRVGDLVQRRSHIFDVAIKEGRTGTLCFVTVDHSFIVGDALRVEDRQTLVYRDLHSAPAAGGADAAPAGDLIEAVMPTPTLLFRYSALTFNGHRIHYDAPYATGVEGYPGLVVHGPLQATLLFHLAARVEGRQPDRFSFRSLSTLFDREVMLLNAGAVADGTLRLWTARAGGPAAMQAEAHWL